MNKILACSLGVFCWFNAAVCFAVEKFDVLPELPDPLAYAVQPAEAASVSGAADTSLLGAQSVGHEPSIISVMLSLVFVILLIYVTGIVYARLNRAGFNTLKKQQGDFARSHVSVVSTTQLGNNKTLHVVELDGKRMLIGASANSMQLIKDLGSVEEDGTEYSHIEIPNIKIPRIEIPKIEIPSIGFSKHLTKAHKNIEEEVAEPEAVPTAEVDTAVEEEINPDGIIDSLFAAGEIVKEEPVQQSSSEHIVDPDEYVLYKKYLG